MSGPHEIGGWGASDAPRPSKFCHACGRQIDARAEICPRCGVRQAGSGAGKDRVVAAAFAILLGGLGIHKFYLGRIVLGVLYLVFAWTGIPSFIGWIEGMTYLARSDADWAAEYGGPERVANGAAIGCLWLIAVLPLLVGILGFIFFVSAGSAPQRY
jgi:hypothetical protein